MKLISSNIRFENEADGDHNWPLRKPVLLKLIKEFSPDLVGTQEGRKPQLEDFSNGLEALSPIWNHRDWIEERMYPSIFANLNKFSLIKSGDIWLSETPDIAGSKSFKSAFPRLATWALLDESGINFFLINAHLDHVLPETRQCQAKVLMTEFSKINVDNLPVIIMGDFNEGPDGNVRKELSHLKVSDPWIDFNLKEEGTHHKFDGNNSETKRIDWILATDQFEAIEIAPIKDKLEGLYPSDHFPIKAEIKFKI